MAASLEFKSVSNDSLRLPLHIQVKFPIKTKTKPCISYKTQILAALCRNFSLPKFCQARYIIKKQTPANNVLKINKHVKNIT